MAKKKQVGVVLGKKILVGYYGKGLNIEKWFPKTKTADAYAYASRIAKKYKTGVEVLK